MSYNGAIVRDVLVHVYEFRDLTFKSVHHCDDSQCVERRYGLAPKFISYDGDCNPLNNFRVHTVEVINDSMIGVWYDDTGADMTGMIILTPEDDADTDPFIYSIVGRS